MRMILYRSLYANITSEDNVYSLIAKFFFRFFA